MTPEVPKKTIDLGALVLQFAQVTRATRFPDGTTPESDTDHTVMLGVIACAFAATYVPRLDVGKIAQYVLVHDLVEAYAGDTNTFLEKSAEQKLAKAEREEAALARITEEFGSVYPWIPETIEHYESLADAEARFVKTLDKVMPKITHCLNRGSELPNLEVFREHTSTQYEALKESYASDQSEVLEQW
jgi:putative hydrolase of HD superfamily